MSKVCLFPYQVQDTPQQNDIPWNLQQVNAPLFWPITKGEGAVVAVIDTGLDINHPEFADRVISPVNFISGQTKMSDEVGHGTHVAGIIGGKTTGIAPACRLMPLKVFGDDKVALNIHDALLFILDWNKKASQADRVVAVNCSFSGPYDAIQHYLIRRLVDSGTAVVVSAGNSGDGDPTTHEIFHWPGFLWEVITTGALNQDGQPAGYSSSYDGIDIGAPGTQVYSAWPGGGYKLLSGTSMATPHITGAYALLAVAFRIREGRYPTTDEGEPLLWKHINKVPFDEALVGRGELDLSYDTKRWPLYRVQLGAYYYKAGAEIQQRKAKAAGLETYVVKY